MTDLDFETTWNEIIYKKIRQLMLDYGDLVCLESSKEEVKAHYNEVLTYAKNHYMVDPNGLLNRYKVASAMMIAILKAKPIKKAAAKYYIEASDKWIFNEKLALNVGLKILADIDAAGGARSLEQKILYHRFSKSIPLRQKERERWEIELYYLRQEGSYNLLSLAHELEDFVEMVVAKANIKRLTRICSTFPTKV